MMSCNKHMFSHAEIDMKVSVMRNFEPLLVAQQQSDKRAMQSHKLLPKLFSCAV